MSPPTLPADDAHRVRPPRQTTTTPLAATLLATFAATLTAFSLAVLPTPAAAFVEEVGSAKVGVQHPEISRYWEGGVKWNGQGKEEAESNTAVKSFANDPHNPDHPGPVMHSVATYAVYWDPQDYYHGDWQSMIDGFLANLGSAGGALNNVFAVDAQYTDATNKPAAGRSSFRGAYTDTNPYPASENCTDPHASIADWDEWKLGVPLLGSGETVCLTDKQIRAQLETFITEQHGIQKGMGTIFYLLTPPGVTVCLGAGGVEGHCSDFDGTINEISYYEEALYTYPERIAQYHEEKLKYNAEEAQYDKELVKYDEERTTYEEEQTSYEEKQAAYEAEKQIYKEEKQIYEKERAEKIKEGKRDEAPPPVEPAAPTPPTEPTPPTAPTPPVEPPAPLKPSSYAEYETSFCSYHSYINPAGSPENGGSKTVLYAVIPWTAGGNGDYHLSNAAELSGGYDCQNGGFEPPSADADKPLSELQVKQHTKIRTASKEIAFQAQSPEKRRAQEEARGGGEEFSAAEPHEQEPNQLTPEGTRDPDSYWDAGLADLIVGQIAVEQQNTVTDPLLNAWQDSAGNEVTDECRNSFFTAAGGGGSADANAFAMAGTLSNQTLSDGTYYLNDVYNLASQRLPYPGAPCVDEITLEPKFTAPSQVNSGEVVGFDGMESDVTLDAAVAFSPSGAPRDNYATFTWSFGDGSTPISGYAPGAAALNSPSVSPCASPWEAPCAASAYHTYQYGGTYNVTLTVTDVGGNTASVTQPITVIGPPAPSNQAGGTGQSGSGSPASTSPTTSTASSSTTTTTAPQSQPSTPPPTPAPALAEVVKTTSIQSALSNGLVVRYSVNEQVAGSLQVLLAATTAQRLGVHGPTATGLPKGSARAIVIGTAVLVTTKAGKGTLRVKFSSRTAERLADTHKLSLTLRLVARNASRQSPRTTVLVSAVVLKG